MVISETLKGNKLNGILIAIAPLLTDLPIVFFSIYLLDLFSHTEAILGVLSIIGSVFLIYLAIQNFRFDLVPQNAASSYSSSIKYGAITNILSPHPYLFWITIGAPTFIQASEKGSASSIAFICGFYLLLIGSKISVAIISGVVKGFIRSSAYKNILRIMGVLLLFLAILLMYEGIKLL